MNVTAATLSTRRTNSLVRRFIRNKAAVLGAAIFVLVAGLAASSSFVYPDSPWEIVAEPFVWPFEQREYALGTDMLGRNVAAGIFYGARVSLAIGVFATIVAVAIGVGVGAVAGYYGGIVDDILMRITEIFQTVPPFIFAIVLVAIFKPSIVTIILAIGAISWPGAARLVRAEFLKLRDRDFVHACIGAGMGDLRIITHHLLPNAAPPIIVMASVMVANAILTEAGLAFLGLGDPNVMSWGTMIGAARDALRNAWYLTAIPGVAILLTVLAINLIGEGLNDALNPRLRDT